MTRQTKSNSDRRRKQASAARIKKNNAVVRAKARALMRAGLLPRSSTKPIAAPIKGGAKALPAEAKRLRREVTKTYAALNTQLIDENLKPVSKERQVKAKKVTEQIANAARQQGATVIKKGKTEYVITAADKKILKSGEIVQKGREYNLKFIKITPRDLVENSDGITPLYRKIEKRFDVLQKKNTGGKLSLYFKADQNNVHTIHTFADPEDMYDFIMSYDEKLLGDLSSFAIMTYSKTKETAKNTGARIRQHKKSYNKPRAKMTDKQREHARNMERIRYALRKSTKPKPKPPEK